MNRKIEILDWGIIFSIIIMFLMIYIPTSIWEEETKFKKEARHRMLAISNAQEFYKELTGEYTMGGEQMFELVEAAMDSLIADSLFLGQRIIKLDSVYYNVNMNEGFEVRVDTTFSQAQNIKEPYIDTIYTILSTRTAEDGVVIDTSFINGEERLVKEISKPNFYNVVDTMFSNRVNMVTDYLRLKYHLVDSLLYCPITKEKYFFHIIDREITIKDNINYIVKGTIISQNEEHIIFQTQNIELDDSQMKNNTEIDFLNSYITKKYPDKDTEKLSGKVLDLKQILANGVIKEYKADLLNKMKNEGILNRIEEYNMFILTIKKDDIISSSEIEESVFSVSTPLSEDYTERRFIIFSFESGDHGRIIDGSTSWSN